MSVFGLLLAALLGSGPVASGGSVTISTVDADQWVGVDVDVEAWNQPTMSVDQEAVKGDASKVSADISRDGSETKITAVYRGEEKTSFFGLVHHGPNIRVHWVVHVPAGVTLSVRCANDPIVVNGVTGVLNAHTSNGNIDVAGAGSRVTAATSNGNVRAHVAALGAVPSIVLRSSNGDVTLSVPHGFNAPVKAGTSNGTVTNPLKNATGSGLVTMRSSNGDIVVTVSN